jgi:hypothetical protein
VLETLRGLPNAGKAAFLVTGRLAAVRMKAGKNLLEHGGGQRGLAPQELELRPISRMVARFMAKLGLCSCASWRTPRSWRTATRVDRCSAPILTIR